MYDPLHGLPRCRTRPGAALVAALAVLAGAAAMAAGAWLAWATR